MSRVAEYFASAGHALRSRYVRLLEADAARMRGEIATLRAENRALVNSLLGTAGVPPIDMNAGHPTVMPVRRRSWPQMSAAREAEAARK